MALVISRHYLKHLIDINSIFNTLKVFQFLSISQLLTQYSILWWYLHLSCPFQDEIQKRYLTCLLVQGCTAKRLCSWNSNPITLPPATMLLMVLESPVTVCTLHFSFTGCLNSYLGLFYGENTHENLNHVSSCCIKGQYDRILLVLETTVALSISWGIFKMCSPCHSQALRVLFCSLYVQFNKAG